MRVMKIEHRMVNEVYPDFVYVKNFHLQFDKSKLD